MSSHHIVRDNQEPALIIANGADCGDELLQQLMEWSPYVLALDGAVHRLLERNIRFDAWLGDFDSGAGVDEMALSKMGDIQRIWAEDQDKTDLEKGIEFLISRGMLRRTSFGERGEGPITRSTTWLLCGGITIR